MEDTPVFVEEAIRRNTDPRIKIRQADVCGGSAADLYGRRRIFVLGVAVFIAASIACGLSPNVVVLIVFSTTQAACTNRTRR
jgi:MFS family permease